MKSLRRKLAELYMLSRTMANLFRLHELVFANRHLNVQKEYVGLDIACGIGLFTNHLLGSCKIATGLDISFDNLKIAKHFSRKNTFFSQANAEQIPFPDKSFDIVISICALEYFSNYQKALDEMRRVLKAKGELILTLDSLQTINSPDFIEFHRKFCMVNNYFTEDSIKMILEKAGFEILNVKSLLRSEMSAFLSICAFRVMKYPLIFNIFSIFAYPITIAADALSSNKTGITIGVHARKK